jgi:hypothetical protein
MDVSTGEPSGKWKQWARWLPLVGFAFMSVWALRGSQNAVGVGLALLGAFAVITYRYRLTEQRFELLIDRHHVDLVFYSDTRGRIWIEWYSEGKVQRTCLGQSWGNSVWLDHEIELGGKRYQLRIYVKPYPDGFMISNVGRGFDMVVLNNTFCL